MTTHEIIYNALQQAGVQQAQLRDYYASAVVAALADATCGNRWDQGTICALPKGHRGWHASAPTYSDETGPQAGGTWTGGRTADEFRTAQAATA